MMSLFTAPLRALSFPIADPVPTATPAPSAISSSLSPTGLVLWVGAGLVIAMGFVVLNAFLKGGKADSQSGALPSSIRAWMAIALVVGLVAYTGASLSGQDESVRSALVGGLVAAVSSATAYFFATAQAQGALNAVAGATATPSAIVPALTEKSLTEALATLGATNFKLVIDAASVPAAANPAVIAEQDPAAGTSTPGNSEIVVKLAPAVASVARATPPTVPLAPA